MSRYDARWLQVSQSRYISLLTPPPLRTKNLNGRLVNDDNLSRYRDISWEQNYSPLGNLFVFRERVCERKAIRPIRIRFGGQKIETALKIIPRWGRGSDNGCFRGQWLWCGQDWGDPPPADLDLGDPSWLDARMMTVTERIIEDSECQTQDWCGLWLL